MAAVMRNLLFCETETKVHEIQPTVGEFYPHAKNTSLS